MASVMEFFLSARLKVMVQTPASVCTRMSWVVSLMMVLPCLFLEIHDLVAARQHHAGLAPQLGALVEEAVAKFLAARLGQQVARACGGQFLAPRSEERRVGKECRSRWSADH